MTIQSNPIQFTSLVHRDIEEERITYKIGKTSGDKIYNIEEALRTLADQVKDYSGIVSIKAKPYSTPSGEAGVKAKVLIHDLEHPALNKEHTAQRAEEPNASYGLKQLVRTLTDLVKDLHGQLVEKNMVSPVGELEETAPDKDLDATNGSEGK
ncbi:MAG: hypothetical protein QE263_02355 [Vampirovibrionales bacterium]|nr:hypothetical protein [Vampirovibrionales bacterium]